MLGILDIGSFIKDVRTKLRKIEITLYLYNKS